MEPLEQGEYGPQSVDLDEHPLFSGVSGSQPTWMSHRDSIQSLGSDLAVIGQSESGLICAVAAKSRPHFGLQFHPEVDHTPCGRQLLANFLDLCHCERNYSLSDHIETVKKRIRDQVGDGVVISLASGGVDSTVSTALCTEALGAERVHTLTIETGLLRLNELEQVCKILERQGLTHLHIEDAADRFLAVLAGITEPEEKRKRIGQLFVEVLQDQLNKLSLDSTDTFICQGTLYTDLIESGKGCGKEADVIKSHHNVGCALIEEKRQAGLLVEPNDELFKDEVRQVGVLLGLPHDLLYRPPFPGPGLAIRIMGEVTRERLDVLRRADAIATEELKSSGHYEAIWQSLCVLLPIDTVGVKGDQRAIGQVIALRCVTSNDGMTADAYPLPYETLGKIASRIANEVAEICRVVYDVTPKPPSTIEWE